IIDKLSVASSDPRWVGPAPIGADASIWITIEGELLKQDPALCIGIAVYSESGETLFWSYQTDQPQEKWPVLKLGRFSLNTNIPVRLLKAGSYRIEFISGIHNRVWLHPPQASPAVVYFTVGGKLSDSPYWYERRQGLLAPLLTWHYTNLSIEN